MPPPIGGCVASPPKRPRPPSTPLAVTVHASPSLAADLSVVLTLCQPRQGEACPITSEPIGLADMAPYAPAGTRPVAAHPDLTCAALPCGHRFDAVALLIHFIRNRMTCPLCRAGVDARMRLEDSPPLGGEAWLREARRQVASRVVAEDLAEADGAMASLSAAALHRHLFETRHALTGVPVVATFLLFVELRPVRALDMQLSLGIGGASGFTFDLVAPDRRALSREIRGSGSTSLSIDVCVAKAAAPPLQVASIHRLRIAPSDEDRTTLIYMEDMLSRIELEMDDQGEVTRFSYLPAGDSLVSIFHDVLPLSDLVAVAGLHT